jgi:hypothetical protein
MQCRIDQTLCITRLTLIGQDQQIVHGAIKVPDRQGEINATAAIVPHVVVGPVVQDLRSRPLITRAKLQARQDRKRLWKTGSRSRLKPRTGGLIPSCAHPDATEAQVDIPDLRAPSLSLETGVLSIGVPPLGLQEQTQRKPTIRTGRI